MDWTTLRPIYLDAIWQTLFMAVITLIVGGILGLVLGIFLFATRRGGLLANRTANLVLNVIVNIVRPIPFIIFMTAIGPLTLKVVGTTIGVQAATFPLCIAATFAMSRIVEQNLVTVDPGVIEAARAMGAGPWRILFDVVAREALGPLVLGYTYVLIAIVDMTAIAGAIGGGGLGQFAIQYGYQRFNWTVTLIAVVTIIIIVQAAQFAGNALARKALRR
ncbi:methionine ABC transporter permease [Acidipropionibacterium virtanenii]|uniref:Methionine import system permease protein MetP n=1 Tax=Acidipropionibacterium virtanenii TaxID=2057246 RepID=A0A344USG5_9ACTN|nr:Methionine import system permease protein MetP [Acidipropionibacterium virtanenii]